MPAKPTLLILGASARAAAGSAIRAGFSPWCADLFADADLRRVASVVRCPIEKYPGGFVAILRAAPDAAWIYTGALENHPNLIRRLSQIRPLWGNGPSALRTARTPFAIERTLREAGLPTPEVRLESTALSSSTRWLRKPLAGSAGNGITFTDTRDRSPSKRHYFQQFIEGNPMSAVFSRVNNKSIVLGTTEQLIGTEWLNAPPFRYAGNFGPVEMSATLKRDLQLIGDVGGEHCGLVGLFGVDFILRDERPWVVEVNPRYTASVEVLELATGIRSLAIDDDATSLATGVVGKAIWYAPHRLVMPNYEMAAGALGVRIQFEGSTHEIECADVPSPGEVIEPTWPVLTIFATARTRDACLKQLRRGADCVRQALCG